MVLHSRRILKCWKPLGNQSATSSTPQTCLLSGHSVEYWSTLSPSKHPASPPRTFPWWSTSPTHWMHLIASASRAAKADRTNFYMIYRRYLTQKCHDESLSRRYWDSLILKIQNRVNHSFSILEVINIWFTSIIEIGDLLNFHFFLDFRFCNNNEIRFYNNQFYKQISLWNFIP